MLSRAEATKHAPSTVHPTKQGPSNANSPARPLTSLVETTLTAHSVSFPVLRHSRTLPKLPRPSVSTTMYCGGQDGTGGAARWHEGQLERCKQWRRQAVRGWRGGRRGAAGSQQAGCSTAGRLMLLPPLPGFPAHACPHISMPKCAAPRSERWFPQAPPRAACAWSAGEQRERGRQRRRRPCHDLAQARG